MKYGQEKMGDQPVAAQFPSNGPADSLNGEALTQEQKFQYDPMPSGKFIRMLYLSQGQPNDPLKGKLELFKVDPPVSSEGGESPLASKTYEPLSYVWGPKPNNGSHQITISTDRGSGSLQLTASLYAALKRLRYTDRERCVWADQICINQEDLAERGQQVQFMNMIYKHASHVLVWLGQDEKDSRRKSVAESAFNLVRKLDETFGDEDKRKEFHAEHFTESALDGQLRDRWVPLDYLVALPWVRLIATLFLEERFEICYADIFVHSSSHAAGSYRRSALTHLRRSSGVRPR